MKKIYLILFSVIFVFSANISISQNATNPFSVKKKKTNRSEVQKVPVSKLEDMGLQQNAMNSSQDYNYKTIPFRKPGALEEINFSNVKYEKNGLLNLAESKSGMGVQLDRRSNESIVNSAREYLQKIHEAMHIKDVNDEFESVNIWTDKIDYTHIKMQQYFKGVKVDGGQVILHAKNGEIYMFNGTYYPTPKLDDVTPAISSTTAEKSALDDVATFSTIGEMRSFGVKQLEYELAVSELVIYHNDRDVNSEQLAWHITLRPNFLERWEYYVDANTSEVIHKYDATCSDGPATANATDLNGINRTISTYQIGSTYYMINTTKLMFNASQSSLPDNPVGAILTIDANYTPYNDLSLNHVTSSNNTWNEASSVSAHYNGSVTYDYYLNTHGRNSINGNGGTIFAVVNVNDENGQSLANAFWNGQAMLYGNGGGVFLPLAGGLDVAAHEMTHGVIQNTAGLKYENQPGAINEAMADIAGAMVDRSNWKIGETVIPANSQYYPSGTLRDMADPHNGGTSIGDGGYQPAHVNEMYTGTSDHGGVHANSGIINHAFYLFAETVGKDKAEQVFYRALANYLTQTSQFIDCRIAFETAAKDIYGNGSAEFNAAANSFYAVGIGDSPSGGGDEGTDPPGQIEVNPGQDYIVSYDVNPLDQNTLYISNTQGSDFVPITTTALKRKPSIVDNGSVGVMITQNSEMVSINMNSPFDENIISPDQIWDNVAVSKDGSRIAAITTSIDSAIYVYDFGKQQWAKFHLYSPTFTEGINMDNVLYADALEWDYTGQYLIYDAYNEMQNDDGDNIDYWDVGFIKVWNNSTNNWGDGNIFKLFSGLSEGVSIGNPSLAKNTPYILAFDYVNQNTGEIMILGANLETGDVGTIYNNNDLGFPNYSKLDNKIVFGTLSAGTEVVNVIGMSSDKINASGGASPLIDVAKWPVWYATGNRDLLDVEENNIDKNVVLVYPNPVSDVLKFTMSTQTNEEYNVAVYNIVGQQIIYEEGMSSNNISEHQLDVSSLNAGTYIVKISLGGNAYNQKFVKGNQ